MAKLTMDQLQEDLEAKTAQLDRIKEGALSYGVVGGVFGDRIVIVSGKGSLIEAAYPFDMGIQIGRGAVVALHPMSGQIVKIGLMAPGGTIATVLDVNGEALQCEFAGGKRVVYADPSLKIEKGCNIVLDESNMVAVLNLGKPAAEFTRGETPVSWDDIGGLPDTKRDLIEAIEHPHLYPDLYRAYNQEPPRGILLKGPPGCGKTMLGKAAATALKRIYDKKGATESAFLYVKGPEVLTKWVGDSEAAIRSLFARAKDHKDKHGFPAVIFLDEAESLLSARGSGISSDMEKTIVPTFLSEMDGLDTASAIMILATNRPDRLDPAIVRDGRVDRKIDVQRPDQKAFEDIVALNLRKVKTADKDLHKLAAEEIFAENREIGSYKHETTGKKVTLILSDVVSGAMAANVVRLAVQMAIRSDIASKQKNARGVCAEHILRAVESEQKQIAMLSHPEAVDDAYRLRYASTTQPRASVAA